MSASKKTRSSPGVLHYALKSNVNIEALEPRQAPVARCKNLPAKPTREPNVPPATPFPTKHAGRFEAGEKVGNQDIYPGAKGKLLQIPLEPRLFATAIVRVLGVFLLQHWGKGQEEDSEHISNLRASKA